MKMIKVIILAAVLMSGTSCKDKVAVSEGGNKTKITATASDGVSVKLNEGKGLAKDAVESSAEMVKETKLAEATKSVEKMFYLVR